MCILREFIQMMMTILKKREMPLFKDMTSNWGGIHQNSAFLQCQKKLLITHPHVPFFSFLPKQQIIWALQSFFLEEMNILSQLILEWKKTSCSKQFIIWNFKLEQVWKQKVREQIFCRIFFVFWLLLNEGGHEMCFEFKVKQQSKVISEMIEF